MVSAYFILGVICFRIVSFRLGKPVRAACLNAAKFLGRDIMRWTNSFPKWKRIKKVSALGSFFLRLILTPHNCISLHSNDMVVAINFWDMPGQDRTPTLNAQLVRDSQVVILVFDLSDKESFDSLREWKNALNSRLG